MGETWIQKGVNKGVGLVGERLGAIGARHLRKAVSRARAQGGFTRWFRHRPAQAIGILTLVGAAAYLAWAFRDSAA